MGERSLTSPPEEGDLFARLEWAREVLGLAETATWGEIEGRFRALIKAWHPDLRPDLREEAEERTRAVVEAYAIIKGYCAHYRFSFRKEEASHYLTGEEWWRWRFGGDPLWGDGGSGES